MCFCQPCIWILQSDKVILLNKADRDKSEIEKIKKIGASRTYSFTKQMFLRLIHKFDVAFE